MKHIFTALPALLLAAMLFTACAVPAPADDAKASGADTVPTVEADISAVTGTVVTDIPAAPAAEAESASLTVLPVRVEGAIFGAPAGESVSAELRFDPQWLTAADNTVYHKGLAAACALLSADVYYREKDLAHGTQNRVLIDGTDPEAYSISALLTALGFEDVRFIESYKTGSYETDTNDSATMLLGYLPFDGCDCFVAVVRGCSSAGEWSSTFDVGNGSAEYTALTGEHPEWTDLSVPKGLSVAAERAMSFLNGYIAEHDDPSRENAVLVTGHSRGSALAELIGMRLENTPGVKSFAYAFNSNPVTTDAAAQDCRTVFNVLDAADLYSDIHPFANGPFYRCGTVLALPVSEREDIRGAIEALRGEGSYVCPDAALTATYVSLFGELFPDRGSLYEPVTLTESFTDLTAAEQRRDTCVSLIGSEAGLGLEAFCSLGEITENGDGTCSFTVTACGGAYLECLGMVCAYGAPAADAVKALFPSVTALCSLADIVTVNNSTIVGGHLLSNTYVLTGYAG